MNTNIITEQKIKFFGFTDKELDNPTPEKGYAIEQHGDRACDWRVVKTFADYLSARSMGNYTPWSSMKDGVHRMPYVWGDQAAESFALVINHELVEAVTGCGDNTPYLTGSEERCLAERKLLASSPRKDQIREEHESNERNNAAFKRGWSDEWLNVAQHIRASYKVNQNPLKGLRKKFPGTWKYLAKGSIQQDSAVGEIRFTALSQLENEVVSEGFGFWGNVWYNWQVSYIPAK